MIVGLTGGIGSGKTTVLGLFGQKDNVAVYMADQRAKWMMNNSEQLKTQLIQVFGNQTFIDNVLNRDHLSKIVFQDTEKLKELNQIVHPAVRKDFETFANTNKDKIIIYEAAILFETKSEHRFDFIINISTPIDKRIERVMKRDNVTKREVLSRIKNQFSENQRNLQSHYVIFNNETEKTCKEVDRIYNILTKKADFV